MEMRRKRICNLQRGDIVRLLYSTIIRINPSLTKEKFVRLIVEWNRTSPHPDNVIPGLVWNGEYNVRYGNDRLSLEIEKSAGTSLRSAMNRERRMGPCGTLTMS